MSSRALLLPTGNKAFTRFMYVLALHIFLVNFRLRPLPGDTLEKGSQQLGASSKAINQGVAHLLSAASQGNENYTAQAARDTAHSLKNFTGAVRAVAATSDDADLQKRIINAGKDVVVESAKLVEEAQRTLQVRIDI